jgi:adenylyl cyclase-associated protein
LLSSLLAVGTYSCTIRPGNGECCSVLFKSSCEGVQRQVSQHVKTVVFLIPFTHYDVFRDPQQIEWTKAFLAIINELYSYVKEHHRTGLVWNPNGESPESAFSKVSSQLSESDVSTPTATTPPPAPAPSAGGPPPPPPPPPPVMTDFEDAAAKPAAPSATGASAIFAELNKGESVTSGLRKVDKSQMTHKNPSLRAGGTVSDDAAKKPRPPTPNKPGKYVLKKPAKTELQGNKWVVENHDGNSDVVIEGEINHAVYIFGCKNSTIRIKGKVNAVTMGKLNIGCIVRYETLWYINTSY